MSLGRRPPADGPKASLWMFQSHGKHPILPSTPHSTPHTFALALSSRASAQSTTHSHAHSTVHGDDRCDYDRSLQAVTHQTAAAAPLQPAAPSFTCCWLLQSAAALFAHKAAQFHGVTWVRVPSALIHRGLLPHLAAITLRLVCCIHSPCSPLLFAAADDTQRMIAVLLWLLCHVRALTAI